MPDPLAFLNAAQRERLDQLAADLAADRNLSLAEALATVGPALARAEVIDAQIREAFPEP